MTTLGELGKIVAEEIKLVRVEAEEVKTQTEEKIETISTQLSGSIETDLSEHENKLRNHEAKIEFNLHQLTRTKDDLYEFNARIPRIEDQILTIQNDLEKFRNISNSLKTYFSSLLESDPQNTNLAQLVEGLSENN